MEAHAYYIEAADITRNALGETRYLYGVRLGNLGSNLLRQGLDDEAVEMFKRALEVLRLHLPEEDPRIVDLVSDIEDYSASDG